MLQRKAILLSVLLLTGQSTVAEDMDAWLKLKGLVGAWQIVDAKTPAAKAFRITYHLISADTALVEEFGNPAKQTTQTIYHADGEKQLLATHYCAQGNQPRLRLQSSSPKDTLRFEFLDATNLKNVDDSHLIRLRFEFVDSSHLLREEVYSENGKETASVISLAKEQ